MIHIRLNNFPIFWNYLDIHIINNLKPDNISEIWIVKIKETS